MSFSVKLCDHQHQGDRVAIGKGHTVYKDLCLLHLRDATAEPDLPLLDILNDSTSLLQRRQLQRVLRERIREQIVISIEESRAPQR